MRTAWAFLCLGVLLGVSAGRARADAPGAEAERRTIAVLEFRAGAAGAHNVGGRLATLLRQTTSHQILDGDDARRIYGAKLDEAVVRCSGEPHCVGQIAVKLGVSEVLLVGVSDLGDVIIAMQRVSARGGAVLARVADSLPRDVEPDDAALDGYLRRLYPREDFLRWGTLRVDANLAGAVVEINGKVAGVTPLAPLRLAAPARVELRVTKASYQDFRASVDVVPDSAIQVRAVLTTSAEPAWYKKSWVWLIAGGVAVAGVTTAIILSQPAPTNVPVIVHF